MKKARVHIYMIFAILFALSSAVAIIISCGGSSTPSKMTTATVNTSISDPPTCSNSAPNGSFDSVYVTITKVTANLNANAGPNDSSWQTLVDLTSAPRQIDLFSLADTTCVLTQLGSTTLLPPGKYQQIRLYLLSNNPASGTATPSSNSCGAAGWNCVVPKDGTPEELQLSSESQTGIKVPASQITSGGLTVSAGQAVDLDINFDTCASLVHQGNHKWRLKPVLHAGKVTTDNNALSGTVVDANTQEGIPGATVSLEQPDSSSGVDVISMGTITDASGNFSFCPLPEGATYDVVVTAQTTVTYNATVTLNVPVGSAMGKILMTPETTPSPSSPATILGQVTTTSANSNPASAGDETAAIITISTFQDAGNNKIVTIPPFSTNPNTPNFTTSATPKVDNKVSATTCPPGNDCENYILTVPASNPSVGMFTQGQPTTYPTPADNSALYWVQAVATVPTGTNAGQADCTPSVFPSTLDPGISPSGTQIEAVPSPVTQDFNFVACESGQPQP